jgi:hypothetical protein
VTTPGPPLRRLDLRSIVRSAGTTHSFGGDYEVQLEMKGAAVSGRYGGSGGLDSVSFSGTRSGDRCRLFAEGTGAMIEATCSASRFDGNVKSGSGDRRPYRIHFEAGATRLVDAAQEESRQQAQAAAFAAEQQRQAAIGQRQAAADAARPATRPLAAARPRSVPAGAARRDGARSSVGIWSGEGAPGPKTAAELSCLSATHEGGSVTSFHDETGTTGRVANTEYLYSNRCSRPVVVYYQDQELNGASIAAAMSGHPMLTTFTATMPAHSPVEIPVQPRLSRAARLHRLPGRLGRITFSHRSLLRVGRHEVESFPGEGRDPVSVHVPPDPGLRRGTGWSNLNETESSLCCHAGNMPAWR